MAYYRLEFAERALVKLGRDFRFLSIRRISRHLVVVMAKANFAVRIVGNDLSR